GVNAEVLDNHVETGIAFLKQSLDRGCWRARWYCPYAAKLQISQTRALFRALLQVREESCDVHVPSFISQKERCYVFTWVLDKNGFRRVKRLVWKEVGPLFGYNHWGMRKKNLVYVII